MIVLQKYSHTFSTAFFQRRVENVDNYFACFTIIAHKNGFDTLYKRRSVDSLGTFPQGFQQVRKSDGGLFYLWKREKLGKAEKVFHISKGKCVDFSTQKNFFQRVKMGPFSLSTDFSYSGF